MRVPDAHVHDMTINVHYRFDKRGRSGPDAAREARDQLIAEWNPTHWHLDYVGVMENSYGLTFSAIIDSADFHSED